MSEKIINVTAANFDQEVIQSTQPVIVDFWAPWCGPCRMVAPVLEELADDYYGKLKVVKINVDENRDLAIKFRVMSIPTMMIFKDGQSMERLVGYMPKHELAAKIDHVLGA